jgi:hypothetical protein
LPDDPNTVAFMDGPVVLAGLNPGNQPSKGERQDASSKEARPNYRIDGLSLVGDPADPGSFLIPDDEREWTYWRGDYRTRGQRQDFRLVPLHEIRDEIYTVYFPIKKNQSPDS